MEINTYEKIVKDFFFLWATIDPIGTLALFASITASLPDKHRKQVALRSVVYSSLILIGAILIGQVILKYMGIQLISLQISGGIILFLFGIQMIFGNNSPNSQNREPEHDIAVFPLAIPSIASPGAIMAVILLTDNYSFNIGTQFFTALVMLLILGITYCFMLLAAPIMKIIGKNGSAILIKLMGMVLAALSIELIMKALAIPKWLENISN